MTERPDDPYRQAYSDGVLAVVDALFEDFDHHGEMTGIRRAPDGSWSVSPGAELHSRGYHSVAWLWETAIGADPDDHPGPAPR